MSTTDSIEFINDKETRLQYKLAGSVRTCIYDVICNNTLGLYEDPWVILQNVIAHIRDPSFDPLNDPLPTENLRAQFTWGNPAGLGFDDTGLYLDGADVKLRSWDEARWIWSVLVTFKDFHLADEETLRDFGAAPTVVGAGGDDPGVLSYQQGAPATKPQQPTEVGAKWSGSFFQVEEEFVLDLDQKPVANSAGQPYPEQRMARGYDTILVEFNTQTISLSQRAAACNAFNDATHWGFTSGQLRLAVWKYQLRHWYDSQQYIWNQMEYWVRTDGKNWKDYLIPDWATAKDDQGTITAITMPDDQGRFLPSTPVMLNGSGGLATPGAVHNNTFRFLPSYTFANLPTPTLPAAIQP